MESESTPSVFEPCDVVTVQPGDVILYRCPMRLADAQRAEVMAMLNEVFPNHESMVLDGGQDIAVLRPVPGFFARLFGKRGAA
jgi:hypothetical protein